MEQNIEIDYIQYNLDINPWNSAGTKSRLSTISNAVMAITDGYLSLQSRGEILDAAKIPEVKASVTGLAKLGAGVVLELKGGKWLVDFGLIHARTSKKGSAKFMNMFNPLSGYNSVKEGKKLRDEFLQKFQQLGGKIT